MKKKVLIIISSLLIVGVLAACQGISPATTRQISAAGTGKVYVVPDLAYVYIGVHTQEADVATALSQNNSQAQSISDTLKGQGIAAEDIQTTAFNVYPQQNYGPDGQPTDTTYAVDNTVFVTIRDLSKLGTILDATVRSGANTINGVSFDVADRTAAENQARELAVENAKANAAELARLGNVTLGQLMSISVYSNNNPTPVYAEKGGAAANSAAPIASGQLVIQVDANLSYDIK